MSAAFDDDTLAGLRDGLRGTAIVDTDEAYDEARTVFNAMIDRRPAVIAQCEDTADVVRGARASPASAASRSRCAAAATASPGWRSPTAALVIDLRRMNAVDGRPGRADRGRRRRRDDEPPGPGTRAATAWPPPAAGSRPPASAASPSAAAPAGWTASSAWPATTCWPPSWSPPTGRRARVASDETPRAVLGAARRRRQLRRRHLADAAAAPAAGGDASRCCSARPRRARGRCGAYRDVARGRPGRGGRRADLPHRPARGLRAGRTWSAGCAARSWSPTPGRRTRPGELAAPLLELGPAGQMIAEMPYAELQCMLDDPPGLPELLVGRVPGRVPGRGGGRVLRPRGRHDRCRRHPSTCCSRWAARSRAGPADYPVPWRRAPWVVHPFGLWDGPGRRRARRPVGARRARRRAAVGDRRGLPQLHRRRGRGAGRRRLRRRRTTTGWPAIKARVRPGQRLPPQPQHRAGPPLAGRGVSNASRDLCGVRGQFHGAAEPTGVSGSRVRPVGADLDCGTHLRDPGQRRSEARRTSEVATSSSVQSSYYLRKSWSALHD